MEAAFRARTPVRAEEVFMVRVILVTREDIISNTPRESTTATIRLSEQPEAVE